MGANLLAHGYNEVEERGNFEKLPADGYVCKIIKAELTRSKKDNEMLVTCVDICEGKYTGYFLKRFNSLRQKDDKAKWPAAATMYQNLYDAENKVNSGLKSLLRSVERSNVNFLVNLADFEANTLNGKVVGIIFRDEEWERDGKSGVTARAAFPRDAQKIRDGDYQVPSLRKLEENQPAQVDDVAASPVSKEPPAFDNGVIDMEDPPF